MWEWEIRCVRVCWHVHGPNSIMSSSCVTICFLLSCFLAFISLLYIVGQFLVHLREQNVGKIFGYYGLNSQWGGGWWIIILHKQNISLYTIEKKRIEMAPRAFLMCKCSCLDRMASFLSGQLQFLSRSSLYRWGGHLQCWEFILLAV